MQAVGDGHTALAGLVFHILGAQVMIQRGNSGLCPHFTTVNTGGQLLLQHLTVVHTHIEAGQDAGLGRLRGVIALEDLGRYDIAVFILGAFPGHAQRCVPQGVQHKTCLLLQGQVLHHVRSTGLIIQTPVLVSREDTVIVHILKIQAVLYDHTAGGDTDGGAVFVVEENRL